MKQKVVFLVGIVIFFLLAVITVILITNRTPKQGELRVESNPSASVFLDNKHIGRTPIGSRTPFKTNAGEYALKIVPESTVQQLASWQAKVKIGPNLLTYVNAQLAESEMATAVDVVWLEKIPGKKSELNVITQPDTATVQIDGETKGMTPIIVPDIRDGEQTITITSNGFLARTVKVNIPKGYRVVVSTKLALSPKREGEVTPTPSIAETGKTPSPMATRSGTIKPTPTKGAGTAGDPEKPFITVKDNEFGFLRVRMEPSKTASEVARLKPGDKRTILKSESGWYQVKYEGSNTGWISASATYVDKTE